MRDAAWLDALHALAWPARRRAGGRWSGTHRATLRGRSPELSEYRAYRAGDDVREMDWRLLARSDRPFIRVTEDRAVHATTFVVDASSSMGFPHPGHEKWRAACRVVTGLSLLAQRAGDPVGVFAGEAAIGPTTRRDVVVAVERLLAGVAPSAQGALAPPVTRLAPGGRLVIVSDLLGDADALFAASRRQARAGTEVLVVHVLSRAERDPEPAGEVVDPESPEVRRPFPASARDGYREALATWVAGERRRWEDIGAGFHDVVAEDPPVAQVRQVVSAGPR